MRKKAIGFIKKVLEENKDIGLSLKGEDPAVTWKADKDKMTPLHWKHIGYIGGILYLLNFKEDDFKEESTLEKDFPSLKGRLEEVPNLLHEGVSGFLLWPGDVRAKCIDKARVRQAIKKVLVLELGACAGKLDYRGLQLMKELGL